MNNEIAFNAMTSILALAGIVYLFFWAYRKYRTELFRQEMFILRDQLFDEAANGLINFEHPAYGMLRSTMNGFIRFAHKPLALSAIFSTAAIMQYEKVSKTSFDMRLTQKLEDLPLDVRHRVMHYKSRMDRLVLGHVFGAPEMIILQLLMLPIAVLILVGLGAFTLFRQVRIRNPLNLIRSGVEDTALLLGK
jgi:hypothetical protein